MQATGVFSRRAEHPYTVDSPANLPETLHRLAQENLSPGEQVNMIFVVPSQILPKKLSGLGGVRNIPEQALLFTPWGALHIQAGAAPGQKGQAISMHGEGLLYAHLSQVLLYGELELCAVEENNLRKIVLQYNTVGHDLLHPWLLRFLRLGWGAQPRSRRNGADHTEELLDTLGKRSFKFRNGLRNYVLQKDIALLGFLFQPRLIKTYLGVIKRSLAPASLLALTETELVMIEEGQTHATSYGWFITYCPRSVLQDIEVITHRALREVFVRLGRGDFTAERRMKLGNTTCQSGQEIWPGLGGTKETLEQVAP